MDRRIVGQGAGIKAFFVIVAAVALAGCASIPGAPWERGGQWTTSATTGPMTPRHEAAFIEVGDKAYLIGGRRINPVEVYDPATAQWSRRAPTPLEIHHFQPVVVDGVVYIIGAMTGGYPTETPVDRVLAYYPETDEFEFLHDIPAARRRGGAGAVAHQGKIYIVGGITNGHVDGSQPWLDVYDPRDGSWEVLADAPHARDHFQAVAVDDRIYAFAGRRSRQRTGDTFSLTTKYGDIFDIGSGKWLQTTEAMAIPTPRAGTMARVVGPEIWIGGGESGAQSGAHAEIEAFDTRTHQWRTVSPMKRGRHGSGFAVINGQILTASGSGNRGGSPELSSIEVTPVPKVPRAGAMADAVPVHAQWHTVTLSFDGPETSELAEVNPFTDFRLDVVFSHGEYTQTIRGFYAADGNAGATSADAGGVWQVRFSPDRLGDWTYAAQLRRGAGIALSSDVGEAVPLSDAAGSFRVVASEKDGRDFRAHGRLGQDGRLFRFLSNGEYWIKGGTNSPENLLAYHGFDGTYRRDDNARDGESTAGGAIHTFDPHRADWTLGDPLWGVGKGKGLIGVVNYLADAGMNVAYFLTMNIDGDGKDVWPYVDPEDVTRFDVSRLEQWNVLFDHMQALGIQLHVVLQETENELLLDGGDTGPDRQLYLHELIARFGHHPALVWNLGEENGPVSWRPEGQNTAQRKAMIDFLTENDPYGHPILLHTHSQPHEKDDILTPLLGYPGLDGLSFQVADPATVADEIRKWSALSAAAGVPWMITMDEIGPWQVGARADVDDPTHDTMRGEVLWGTFMSGGAGVEWYFGAHQRGNDLSTEDLRSRAELWRQTAIAMDFFQNDVTADRFRSCDEEMAAVARHCAVFGEAVVLYGVGGQPFGGTVSTQIDGFNAYWFDPMLGGAPRDAGRVSAGAMWPTRPEPNADAVLILRAEPSDGR